MTIDSTRTNIVWVNSAAATFTNGVDILAGGQITQTRSGYVVTLNTGESVTATIDSLGSQIGPGTTSAGIDTTIALNPFIETPGTIQGLLGNANGNPSQDLTLADGTVLPTNMPTSELYGAYANSWRVTQATALLDYGPGQTTATFTDANYPGQAITLASFPQALVQAAEALAAQAGITDPGLQQAAAFDYLVTGAASSFIVEANLQQQGSTTAATADFTTPTPGPMVGIIATAPTEAETSSGPTTADFQVYRSGDTSAALTVTYSVVAPDASFVGASAFGGSLPSGTISFAAGQATADLPITLAQGIGAVASQMLAVQITAPSSTQVIGSTAQLQILNDAPVVGPAPSFAVELIDDQAVTPIVSGNTWTFNLAAATQGAASSTGTVELAVLNAASLGADSLSGTITAIGDGGIPTTITQSFSNLAPSALTDIAALDLAAAIAATGTETLTIALTETNGTGYSASLPTETVIIQNSAASTSLPVIAAPASATLNVGQATAISGVSIAENGNTSGELFAVTLTDTNGLLSATGIGVQASGSTTLTITGSLSQVNADLATLQDTNASTAADTITLNATDSLGNNAAQAQIAITVQNTTTPSQPGGTTPGTGTAPGNSTPTASMPVYRFFDTLYGTHLFTQSLSEAQSILATRPDLTEETNNFGAVNPQTDPNAEAVYRFFETSNGTHFFTASYQEYLGLTTPGTSTYRADLTYEASSTFYEDSTQQSGDVAVYRLFDTVHGTQFLTGSQSEYTGLTTAGTSTYRPDLSPEGIAFYAPAGNF